jgi:hypothetical protein
LQEAELHDGQRIRRHERTEANTDAEKSAYDKKIDESEPALFVLDSNGVVFWSYPSPVAVNPGADGILNALERLSNQRGPHEHSTDPSNAA